MIINNSMTAIKNKKHAVLTSIKSQIQIAKTTLYKLFKPIVVKIMYNQVLLIVLR